MNNKILIIEDEPVVADMYKRLFELGQLEAEVALGGEEGFKKAKEIKPRLILLDVVMPKMNGLQVLESIKKDPQIQNIPIVVMLTNIDDKATMDRANNLGAAGYIVKASFDSNKLLEIVRSYLR